MKIWQVYNWKHLHKISVRISRNQWVYGDEGCGYTDFFVYMDGHSQPTVELFPCSLAIQGFKVATMGITVWLFVIVLATGANAQFRPGTGPLQRVLPQDHPDSCSWASLDLQFDQYSLSRYRKRANFACNCALFKSDTTNIGWIANVKAGGERAPRTAQSAYWSWHDTIRTQILNYSQCYRNRKM